MSEALQANVMLKLNDAERDSGPDESRPPFVCQMTDVCVPASHSYGG